MPDWNDTHVAHRRDRLSQDAGLRGKIDHEDSVDGHESAAVFRCQEQEHWNAARWRFHDGEEQTAMDRPPARAWRWLLNTPRSPSISRHWSKILPGLRPSHPAGSRPCCRNSARCKAQWLHVSSLSIVTRQRLPRKRCSRSTKPLSASASQRTGCSDDHERCRSWSVSAGIFGSAAAASTATFATVPVVNAAQQGGSNE